MAYTDENFVFAFIGVVLLDFKSFNYSLKSIIIKLITSLDYNYFY